MTTTPSPAPQWAINVAKAIHNESWHGMTYDQMVNSGAAIITKHAAAISEENERLKRELLTVHKMACAAGLERDTLLPSHPAATNLTEEGK